MNKNKKFPCFFCPDTFPKASDLSHHEMMHDHLCFHCVKCTFLEGMFAPSFVNYQGLVRHQMTEHGKTSVRNTMLPESVHGFECKVCSMIFLCQPEDALRRHFDREHNTNLSKYEEDMCQKVTLFCRLCKMRTSKLSEWKSHFYSKDVGTTTCSVGLVDESRSVYGRTNGDQRRSVLLSKQLNGIQSIIGHNSSKTSKVNLNDSFSQELNETRALIQNAVGRNTD